MTQRSEIWLLTGDDTRQSMGLLHRTPHGLQHLRRHGQPEGFHQCGATNIQAGNAMLIYASTNTNSWTLYYYDSPSSTLYRTNWDGTSVGDFRMVFGQPRH